jgi:hypothetical protein
LQAETGTAISTLRHEILRLKDWERPLVARLDGSYDRDQLRQWFWERVANSELVIEPIANEEMSPEEQKRTLENLLEQTLERLAQAGVFVG